MLDPGLSRDFPRSDALNCTDSPALAVARVLPELTIATSNATYALEMLEKRSEI